MRPSPAARGGTERFEALPGWELVGVGLEDLRAGKATIEAALVEVAGERLRALGLAIDAEEADQAPERLYEMVEADVGEARAHSRYNALRRRLASFIRSAGHATAD